jgi:programmed cell death 6-interacting protein
MAFLGVPCKKGYDVDLIRPLNKFIEETYGSEQAASHKQSLDDFQNMRNKVLTKLNDRHESAIEILNRYYDQLVAVETKIPMAENAVRIDFRWQDAFDSGSLFSGKNALKLQSSGYERIAILFNIAAISSQVATDSANSGDDQSLKTAAKLFQQSSGLFSYVKNYSAAIIQRNATTDLTKDCLCALTALMVAQGQDCIFHKAAKDKMKHAIVAKIAQQGAELYSEAKSLLNINSMKTYWPKEWLAIVNCKAIAFQALAQFYQGHACGDARAYGEQIGRYKYAEELMKSAQGKSGSQFLYSDYLDRIKRCLVDAEKDNNIIYHETVPSSSTLSKIDKAILAKEIVPTFPLSEGNKDLFDRLVSVAVHSAMTTFDGYRQQAVNFEVGRLREATDLINSVLASLNLPASLEDDSSHDVPPSLLEKASKIRQAGGITALKQDIENLPDLLQRNKEILTESRRMLDEEKDSDDKLRQQFGPERWTRTPSEKLTESWRQEAEKFQRILDQATQSDGVVHERYQKHADAITLLSKSDADIRKALPQGNTAGDSASFNSKQREAKDELKVLCQRVDQLKTNRKSLEEEIQKSSVENIGARLSEALAQDGALRVEDISQEYVNKLMVPLREKVSESLQEQESLLNVIQQRNTEYTGGQSSSGSAQSRAELLSNLASAFDQFEQLKSNLQEGAKFYGDLTEILLKFQSKVQDFCFARRTEKEELMKDLQRSMVQQRTDVPTRGDNQQPPQVQQPKSYPPPPRPPPLSAPVNTPVAPEPTPSVVPPPANHGPTPAAPPAPAAAAPPPSYAPGYQSHPPPQSGHQPGGYYPAPQYNAPPQAPPQGYLPYSAYPPYGGGMPQPQQPYVPGMPPQQTGYYPGAPQGGYPHYQQQPPHPGYQPYPPAPGGYPYGQWQQPR